jgi:hypothetical protein
LSKMDRITSDGGHRSGSARGPEPTRSRKNFECSTEIKAVSRTNESHERRPCSTRNLDNDVWQYSECRAVDRGVERKKTDAFSSEDPLSRIFRNRRDTAPRMDKGSWSARTHSTPRSCKCIWAANFKLYGSQGSDERNSLCAKGF